MNSNRPMHDWREQSLGAETLMRAAVIDGHGGPEVFRMTQMPRPRLVNGEVLVRVLACGLNHGLDGRTRENGAGRHIQFPHILGTEIVGRIDQLGPGSDRSLLGRNVIVVPWVADESSSVWSGVEQEPGPNFRLRGVHVPGGNAEFVAAQATQVLVLPDGVSVVKAAALPISYTTASHLLSRSQLKKGERILILGAAGTIGIATIQLAKHIGATVIGAASSQEKLNLARRLGADMVLNYKNPDWPEQVLAMSGGQGVDVVIEHIGETTWAGSLASLAHGGRIAMCGASSGWNLQIDARSLWRKNISLHFANAGSAADLRNVVELWLSGKIDPLIAGTFPLEKITEAHRMLSRRDTIGKLVLTMD